MEKPVTRTIEKEGIVFKTYVMYTGLFLLMVLVIFSYFALTKTSFIWESDGFTQHYQLFVDYISKLREWISGGDFPMWDWNIGLGADVLYSYGYYVIGDPVVYLGLLFPSSLMEEAYHILILLRVWAIGASFLFFARNQKVSHYSGLTAAIAYAFTHFAIFNITRHPFFLLPLIWYPLLCLGIEKILKNKSPFLFTLVVALSALSNFYFFYKLTLLVVIYALIRFVYLQAKWDWKSFIAFVWKGSCAYIIGLLISAVLFLPMIFGFLESSRHSGGMDINLFFYPLEYYIALVQHTISPGSYFWMIGGFPILSIFGLVYSWKRSGFQFIRTAILILFVLLLFPFFGSMMNGFSGPYNRFSFALPFFFSLALAFFLDHREKINTKDLERMKWVLVFFSVFSLVGLFYFNDPAPYMPFPVILGWGIWSYLKHASKKTCSYQIESCFFLAVVLLNMAANAMYYYYPFGGNAVDELLDYGVVEDEYDQLLAGGQDYLPDQNNNPYRVGVTSQDNHVRNQFLYLDVMGLNSYLSITNSYVADFAYEIETSGFQVIQPLRNGIDDRRIANHLLSVRYIITDKENQSFLPFGYEIVEELTDDQGQPFILAETNNAYPFAYATSNVGSETAFLNLNAIEREAVLSVNTVLDDGVLQNLGLEDFSYVPVVKKVPFRVEVEDSDNVFLMGEEIRMEQGNATFTVVLERPEELTGHELFVRLDGLDYRPLEEIPWLRQPTSYRVQVHYNQLAKSVFQSDQYSFSSYFHRENMLFNLGYVTENNPADQLDIVVDQPGIYSFEEISVYALPVNAQEDETKSSEKKERALDIQEFTNERLEGTITAQENDILVTSIPYAEGWSAVVNGEEAETIKINIGFVGVVLSEGENEVQLNYQTPLLRSGAILSIVGIALAGLNSFIWNKKKSQR